MLLCQTCPFIRFAQELTYNPTGKRVCPGDSRIFYVLSGEGNIVIRDETFSMKERTFVLINAGIPYQITSDRLLTMIALSPQGELRRLSGSERLHRARRYERASAAAA